jgi:fibronectin type 3 domain-containing protein
MRRAFHSWPALRGFCLFSLAALSLFAGCGKKLIGESQTPAAPANPHSVTINWTTSKSTVAGYNVYRSSPPGAPIKLTVRIVSETQYTDRTVEAGRTYSYVVTAVDFKGLESKPSANITVTVPTTVPPPAKQ